MSGNVFYNGNSYTRQQLENLLEESGHEALSAEFGNVADVNFEDGTISSEEFTKLVGHQEKVIVFRGKEYTIKQFNQLVERENLDASELTGELGEFGDDIDFSDGIDQNEFDTIDNHQESLGTVSYKGSNKTLEEINEKNANKLEKEFGTIAGVDYSDGINPTEFLLIQAVIKAHQDAETSDDDIVIYGGREYTISELNELINSQNLNSAELTGELGDFGDDVNFSDGVDEIEFDLIKDSQESLSTVSYKGGEQTFEEINKEGASQLQNEFGAIAGVDYSDGINAEEFEIIQGHQVSEELADRVMFKGQEYTLHQLVNTFTPVQLEEEFGSIPGVDASDGLSTQEFERIIEHQEESIVYRGEDYTIGEFNQLLNSENLDEDDLTEELGDFGNDFDISDGIDQNEFDKINDSQEGLGTVSYKGGDITLEEINEQGADQLQDEFGSIDGVDYSDGINAAEFEKIQEHQASEELADRVIFKGQEYTLHQLINTFTRDELEDEFGSIPGVNARNGLNNHEFDKIVEHQEGLGTLSYQGGDLTLEQINGQSASQLQEEFGTIANVDYSDGINSAEFEKIQQHQASEETADRVMYKGQEYTMHQLLNTFTLAELDEEFGSILGVNPSNGLKKHEFNKIVKHQQEEDIIFRGEEYTIREFNELIDSQNLTTAELNEELGDFGGNIDFSDGVDQKEFDTIDSSQESLGDVSYGNGKKDLEDLNEKNATQLQQEFGTIAGVDYRDGVNAAEFKIIQDHQESEKTADTVIFKGEEYTMHELINQVPFVELEAEFGSIEGVNLQDGVLDASDFTAVDDAQAQSGTVLFDDDPISLLDLNKETTSDLVAEYGDIEGVDVSNGINLEEFKIIQRHQAGELAHEVDREQLKVFVDIGVFAPAEIEKVTGGDGKVSKEDFEKFLAEADGADGSEKDGVLTTAEVEAWKSNTKDFKEFTAQAYVDWFVQAKVDKTKSADFLGDYFAIEDNYGSVNAVDYVNDGLNDNDEPPAIAPQEGTS